jgi:hypothetical protein
MDCLINRVGERAEMRWRGQLYSAIIGYAGVLWAGVGMSLYLGCRPPPEQLEFAEGS